MARMVRMISGLVLAWLPLVGSSFILWGVPVMLLIMTGNFVLGEFTAIGILVIGIVLLASRLPSPRRSFGNVPFWIALTALSPTISVVSYSLGRLELEGALIMGAGTPALVTWLQFAAILTLYLSLPKELKGWRKSVLKENR